MRSASVLTGGGAVGISVDLFRFWPFAAGDVSLVDDSGETNTAAGELSTAFPVGEGVLLWSASQAEDTAESPLSSSVRSITSPVRSITGGPRTTGLGCCGALGGNSSTCGLTHCSAGCSGPRCSGVLLADHTSSSMLVDHGPLSSGSDCNHLSVSPADHIVFPFAIDRREIGNISSHVIAGAVWQAILSACRC